MVEYPLLADMAERGHEQVVFVNDAPTGLRAVIAIHSTALGPALGGVRFWTYPTEAEAVTDALRLSEAMTLKAASWFKVVSQTQDARVFFQRATPGPPYQDTWNLRQAYAEFGDIEKSAIALRSAEMRPSISACLRLASSMIDVTLMFIDSSVVRTTRTTSSMFSPGGSRSPGTTASAWKSLTKAAT